MTARSIFINLNELNLNIQWWHRCIYIIHYEPANYLTTDRDKLYHSSKGFTPDFLYMFVHLYIVYVLEQNI